MAVTSLDALAALHEIRAAKNLCTLEHICAMLDGLQIDDADDRLVRKTLSWSARGLAKKWASAIGVSARLPEEVDL